METEEMNTSTQIDEPIFDLKLLDIVEGVGIFLDPAENRTRKLPLAGGGCCGYIGQRGVAMPGEAWRFHPYPAQSLERVPELDQPGRLGWKCCARPEGFTCPAWIVPGEDGAFIEDETEAFQIRVPPEFMDLCDRYGMDVEDVLHGFIADAAGLMNWVRCPRADELSSNGSEERMLAQEYLDRAWYRGV